VPSIHTNRGVGRARKARIALDLPPDRPLLDVVADIEEHGGVRVVVLDIGAGVAGAYIRRPDCPLIFVNGRHSVARQRFTVAHEFGHHRLEHTTIVDRLAALTDTGHDPQEVEANAFAAEFLIPRAALEKILPSRVAADLSLEHVVRIASAFGVSAEMARYRLASHGVLSDPAIRARIDAEIAEELHVELAARLGIEEHADTLSAVSTLPRIPDGLRAGAFGEFLAGDLDRAGLARQLGRPPAAVDQMLTGLGLDDFAVTAAGP
jgi:Zn-dependent peptidase ImmA (M78 family)